MTKSLNDATPAEWDRVTQKFQPTKTEYVDPYDQPKPCPVNNPDHYNAGKIECIEAIEESMTPNAFKGYCKGNALKYIWRMHYKGKPVEDIRKAIWYLERLIDAELANPSIFEK